jgi:micrococcal nuclease
VRALVSRVIDGETIEASIDNSLYRVRYIGVDAPGVTPTLEWQGPQSIVVNSELVSGKFVTLVKDISEADAAGFLLRYVVVDNLFVNYDLIRTGYARAQIVAPDVACGTAFLAAQSEAQTAMLGVWSATPIPSSTFTATPTITLTRTDTKTATPLPPSGCDCSKRYTCNDFTRQAAAQACYDYCGPTIGLDDKNNNGLVCEGLP